MNQYPPRVTHADVRAVALFALAVALLVMLVLSMSASGDGGGSQPLTAPAGLGL